MNDFGQVGDLGGHLGAKMGSKIKKKLPEELGMERLGRNRAGRRQRRVQWEGKGGNKSHPD